jgi:hypothetical protein
LSESEGAVDALIQLDGHLMLGYIIQELGFGAFTHGVLSRVVQMDKIRSG